MSAFHIRFGRVLSLWVSLKIIIIRLVELKYATLKIYYNLFTIKLNFQLVLLGVNTYINLY